MKLLYVGFNLYGQFISSQEPSVNEFTEGNYDDGLIDVIYNHTCAIFNSKDDVQIHGEIRSDSHRVKSVQLNLEDKNVIGVSANEEFALILTDSGGIFKLWLDNFVIENVRDFLTVENNCGDDKIRKVQCGYFMNVALSAKGCLYNIPNKFDFKSGTIKDISVGREHCLVLTEDGCVYSFGRGSRGQLGHGDLEELSEPTLIAALNGIKIRKISTGGWHSAALSCEGDLYTWGWNANCQLGILPQDDLKEVPPVMASPRVVDVDKIDNNVIDVACGNRHTVVLLDDNKLYGCGWNKYRQLGVNIHTESEAENIDKFVLMHDFKSTKVIDLKCAPWATAVLIE